MANISNKVNKEKAKEIILKLVEEKKILKEGTNYSIIKGEERIYLGCGYENVLNALIEHGVVTPSEPTPEDLVTPPEPKSLKTIEAQNNLATSNKTNINALNEILEKKLGDVDFTMYSESGDDIIFIDGIDSRYDDHPKFKSIGWKFAWVDMQSNVIDEEFIRSKSWVSLNKDWVIGDTKVRGIIKTVRDDKPLSPYYVRGENMICVMRLSDYKKKKFKKQINEQLRQLKEENKRKETLSKGSIESSVKKTIDLFKGENDKDSDLDKQFNELKGLAKKLENGEDVAESIERAQKLVNEHF